jgi:hypothetical protein
MLDWQTEEGQTWDEKPQPATAVSPWPRRLVWLLVGVLLLGGGGWYTAGLVQERIETATTEAEAELRQAYGLLRQAAERQDTDLFNLLLSGRDVEWARAQEQLLREGQLLDRPTWGLVHRPELGADDPVTEIVLSPDLLAAEITAVEPYQFWSIADQQVKTARLQHTAVYRLGPDRWLYAPPEPEFWGETREVRSDTLRLTYPERDHEVVEQLFPNLSALMANTCRLPGFYCRAFRVEFVTDPATLGQSLKQAIIGPDEPILLPTPTLMGVPRDAAGYEFLWLAYGRYLSSVVVTQQTNYRCCGNAIYYQILLHYQLAQLKLHDWPLSPVTAYEQSVGRFPFDDLFNQTIFLDSIHTSFIDMSYLADVNEAEGNLATITFRQMPPALQTTYLLIDYLAAGHNLVPADLQRQLFRHDQLLDWLNVFSPVSVQSETHLWLQLADHLTRYRPDVARPTDSLTITCAPISRNIRLTYDPLNRTWQERALPPLPAILTKDGWPTPSPRQVYPTPASDLYLVDSGDQLFLATADSLHPIQWEGTRPVDQGALQVTLQPNGRLLNLTWELLRRNQRLTTHYQLDLDECTETGCPVRPALGQVFWAPDGRYSLIAVSDGLGETPGLYLGDEAANRQAYVEAHYERLPVTWLGHDHFAYATLTADEDVQYNIQALAGERPLAITAADLTNLLPNERDPLRPVQPIELVPNPANPHHILLLAAKPWIRGQVGTGVTYEHYYLIWLALTADFGQIEQVALVQDMGGAPFDVQINPAGNLAIIYYSRFIFFTLNLPHDPQGSALTPVPVMPVAGNPPLWSPNGKWLALTTDFGLVLTAPPTFDLVHLAPYDLANCFHSQWSR